MLYKNAGFTIVATLVLALGIGGAAAIFTVVDAVVLRPLPYPDPERLVWVWEKTPDGYRNNVAAANFMDWRDQNAVFEGICATAASRFTLSGVDQPEQFSGSRVSANFFDLLGATPLLGRTFLPEEEEPGRSNVVVLRHRGGFGAGSPQRGWPHDEKSRSDERHRSWRTHPKRTHHGSQLTEVKYPDASGITLFFRDALERIEALPGVRSAGITTTLPLQGSRLAMPIEVAGSTYTGPVPNLQRVSPGYFHAMGIELLEGRWLTDRDTETSARVAVVNETFVNRL